MSPRIADSPKLFGLVIYAMICGSTFYSAQALSGITSFQKSENKAESTPLSQLINQWSNASAAHKPGQRDAPAVKIGSWPASDLEEVLKHIHKLASQPTGSLKRNTSRGQVRRMLGLTDQEAKQGDLSRLLKQGALLHTDIALLELGTSAPSHNSDLMGRSADGRLFSVYYNPHWRFTRELLDLIPSPAQDPLVLQWYVATTAYMQSRRELGYSRQNLKPALEKFPADAHLNFYAGVLHETYASPSMQNRTLLPGWEFLYDSEDKELKSARKFLQKAVTADPAFMEARLHYGRVLGLLGDHRQAEAELQLAVASISDPQLLYYGSLHLGQELEALAQLRQAREQYERAVRLYPMSQSPLLALSHLADRSDDLDGTNSLLQRVFALNVKDIWKDDPWWSYDVAHVRNASVLIAEMYRMFGGAAQ
jgi:tetratricopeptide (TPR) repeat protein